MCWEWNWLIDAAIGIELVGVTIGPTLARVSNCRTMCELVCLSSSLLSSLPLGSMRVSTSFLSISHSSQCGRQIPSKPRAVGEKMRGEERRGE